MISSKKRLVNFVDSGADASVPWYDRKLTYSLGFFIGNAGQTQKKKKRERELRCITEV
jgi:hypothetical protein